MAGDDRCGAPATSRIVFTSTTAQLFVADVKTSSVFFTTTLGFELDFLYGDPPYYGVVKRGNGRIALRLVCEPVFVGDIREREHLLSASIMVQAAIEIKELFLESLASPEALSMRHRSGLSPSASWGAPQLVTQAVESA